MNKSRRREIEGLMRDVAKIDLGDLIRRAEHIQAAELAAVADPISDNPNGGARTIDPAAASALGDAVKALSGASESIERALQNLTDGIEK